MLIRAILEWDAEAEAFSATFPELNFVSSCGDSHDEAIANLKDAIQLLLEPLPKHLRIARQQEIDASIAAKADQEFLYDKPFEDNKKVRVAGPFTVESLSPTEFSPSMKTMS